MQQGCHLCQQANVLGSVPIVFVLGSQDVFGRGVGGDSALRVKTVFVPHNPKQFGVVKAAYPVAGNGGIFACGLA